MNNLRQTLYGDIDLYEGVIPRSTVRRFTDPTAFYSSLKDEGFAPEEACEVGSWCGLSALRFAQIFECPIVCVDTWLGSEEHWIDRGHVGHDMHLKNGRPRIYEEFLESTYQLRHLITPFSQTSTVASKIFNHYGFKFDFIYLDGDHSADGVDRDIKNYLPLLNEGGILAGDDLNDKRFGVKKAVSANFGDEYKTHTDNWWYITK